MIRIFLPLICAALGLAAASCTQSDGSFAPAEAPASPQPIAHGAASAAMASSPQTSSLDAGSTSSGSQASDTQSPEEAIPEAPAGMAAERRASTLIGMPVVSTRGDQLGRVKDLIFDRQGRATHVVIAYAAESAAGRAEIPGDGKSASPPDAKLTAMPWDAAMASIKDDRLVLESAKLQGAPSFTPDAWPNLDDPAWSATTDTYWRKAVQAAIAAHPGKPIDSTARQRERPTRDDN